MKTRRRGDESLSAFFLGKIINRGMPSRALPNLGLKAFFIPGEDGWGNDVSQNFLKLSTLVQAGVISVVTTLPTTPQQGNVYLLGAAAASNPNKIAIYDANAWSYLTPAEGWMVFDRAADVFHVYNGSTWVDISLANLVSITGRDVGAGSATSLLDRATGDARYSLSAGSVGSFNGRTGAVTLTQADITATGFTGAVASFNGRTGAVTLTQADLTALTFNFTHLDDVQTNYVGNRGMYVRVNDSETGLVFAPNNLQIAPLNVDTTVNAVHGGAYLRMDSADETTITIPVSTDVPFPIGTRIYVAQAGAGAVTITGAVGVQIDVRDGLFTKTGGQHSLVTLVQYDTDQWHLYGDLLGTATVETPAVDATSDTASADSDTLSADNAG